MARPYLSLQEPHISTPYSHYTSLFNSARFHSDRCDVKSLCKLWCYFSVKSLEVLFLRRHSFQERKPTPNHNLNKVCIQKIFQTLFGTYWVITNWRPCCNLMSRPCWKLNELTLVFLFGWDPWSAKLRTIVVYIWPVEVEPGVWYVWICHSSQY